ncbi:MAG: hypothetical protein H0V29_03570 [Thermoleophilaceae bacterium]|nr:hypothetical protein [Thermoleophilaceae bacterium]
MTLLRPHTGARVATGVALALFLVPAGAAAQTGGAAPPAPGAAPVQSDPGFVLSSKRSTFVGRALSVKGTVAGASAGVPITLQADDGTGFAPVASAATDDQGSFRVTWTPPSAGRFKVRAVVDPAAAGQAGASRTSGAREVTVYAPTKATWYGPGFYGNRTACGERLTRSTQGIAHRTLPCGTQVAISYKGRSVTVPVIDRGPFANGADVDLAGATAKRLGVNATVRVGLVELDEPAAP